MYALYSRICIIKTVCPTVFNASFCVPSMHLYVSKWDCSNERVRTDRHIHIKKSIPFEIIFIHLFVDFYHIIPKKHTRAERFTCIAHMYEYISYIRVLRRTNLWIYELVHIKIKEEYQKIWRFFFCWYNYRSYCKNKHLNI